MELRYGDSELKKNKSVVDNNDYRCFFKSRKHLNQRRSGTDLSHIKYRKPL